MTDSSKSEATESPSKTTKAPRRAKHMTNAQWTEAKALWESGEFTLTQISKRVGVTKEHLSRKFKKEGIEKGSKSTDVKEAAKEAVEDAVAQNARVLPMRIAETKEQHYKWSESLGKLTMKTVGETLQSGRPMAAAGEDLKAIERAAAILGKVMDQRYKALGIDKEDYVDEETLPSLSIEVMTEEEMDAVRNKAREQTLGVDDGMGGVLDDEIIEYDEDEDDIILEDDDDDIVEYDEEDEDADA